MSVFFGLVKNFVKDFLTANYAHGVRFLENEFSYIFLLKNLARIIFFTKGIADSFALETLSFAFKIFKKLCDFFICLKCY